MKRRRPPPEESDSSFAELVEHGAELHAINIRVIESGTRTIFHAGHVLQQREKAATEVHGGPFEHDPMERLLAPAARDIALEAVSLVRGWVEVARALQPFHHIRLHLGGEEADGFDPDRIVFEWRCATAPPLESVPLDDLENWTPRWSVPDYPAAQLESLRKRTRGLVALGRRAALDSTCHLRIVVQTRLLGAE